MLLFTAEYLLAGLAVPAVLLADRLSAGTTCESMLLADWLQSNLAQPFPRTLRYRISADAAPPKVPLPGIPIPPHINLIRVFLILEDQSCMMDRNPDQLGRSNLDFISAWLDMNCLQILFGDLFEFAV